MIDEAHHVEAGTRGILLEQYLWRLQRMVARSARFVFLSAVATNVGDLASSVSDDALSVSSQRRSTRMRIGVYRIRGRGKRSQGWVDYVDGTEFPIVQDQVESSQRRQLVQLASQLSVAGRLLVVAQGKGTCETLAATLIDYLSKVGRLPLLSDDERESHTYQRLDSRLEREMYEDVPMRSFLRHRIAYHHAGLPPRVRIAVEDAIKAGLIDYVFATTTLSEGVNFPFSTVVVQTLALREGPQRGRPVRYQPVTPRVFWNIPGRAGRPGTDREGQVILFEPSLGLERINYVLDNYTDARPQSVGPMDSALRAGISKIREALDKQVIYLSDLTSVQLRDSVPADMRGTINLIRVGLVHAKAAGLVRAPDEILDGTFAASLMSQLELDFALRFIRQQDVVVDQFFSANQSIGMDIAAQIGLSIESLSNLFDFVETLTSAQISAFNAILIAGWVNLSVARRVIAPTILHVKEMEGGHLSLFLTEVVVRWLDGMELSRAKEQAKFDDSLEELISVIYSRVQYLLPWGLYALDTLVEARARRLGIHYGNPIRALAYLVDEGVPGYDALRLVNLHFERVDATRLVTISDQQRCDVVGGEMRRSD